MDAKSAYLDIVDRELLAAKATLDEGIHEAATFHSYHAFESLGGAFCEALGRRYPRSHKSKLNTFVSEANRSVFRQKISRQVAVVAMILASVRNECLYPIRSVDKGFRPPRSEFDAVAARRMKHRVAGLCSAVKKAVT